MKKWLEKKFINIQKNELQTFIDMLRGGNNSEVAMTIAISTHLRNSLPNYSSKLLNPIQLIMDEPYIALDIGKLIKAEQKAKNPAFAAGWMVWLHTVRSCDDIHLRHLGKSMWKELERGQQFITDHYEYQDSLLLMNLDIDDYECFPEGLNPNI
ncbi:MAG: hypothetical protein H3C49_07290 [Alphaproteobacteria bacterium]|nr:hypothetical protein [Alphaproteobacteria bacterium]